MNNTTVPNNNKDFYEKQGQSFVNKINDIGRVELSNRTNNTAAPSTNTQNESIPPKDNDSINLIQFSSLNNNPVDLAETSNSILLPQISHLLSRQLTNTSSTGPVATQSYFTSTASHASENEQSPLNIPLLSGLNLESAIQSLESRFNIPDISALHINDYNSGETAPSMSGASSFIPDISGLIATPPKATTTTAFKESSGNVGLSQIDMSAFSGNSSSTSINSNPQPVMHSMPNDSSYIPSFSSLIEPAPIPLLSGLIREDIETHHDSGTVQEQSTTNPSEHNVPTIL